MRIPYFKKPIDNIENMLTSNEYFLGEKILLI